MAVAVASRSPTAPASDSSPTKSPEEKHGNGSFFSCSGNDGQLGPSLLQVKDRVRLASLQKEGSRVPLVGRSSAPTRRSREKPQDRMLAGLIRARSWPPFGCDDWGLRPRIRRQSTPAGYCFSIALREAEICSVLLTSRGGGTSRSRLLLSPPKEPPLHGTNWALRFSRRPLV